MIISHKYRFIFVKTRKTGGTSVEIALSRHCGPDDVVTPIMPEDEALRAAQGGGPQNWQGRFNPLPELIADPIYQPWRSIKSAARGIKYVNHLPAVKIRARTPRAVWDGYYKFCFERNPWDKTVSQFYWWNRGRSVGPGDFDAYVAEGDFVSDWPLYTIGGKIAVDFVGRYETLEDDYAKICLHLGIPFEGLGTRAKGQTRPREAGYRSHYSDASREAVAKAFAREIAAFGYAF